MKILISIAALATTALFVPSSAHAQAASTQGYAVTYADLDLSKARDLARLDRRISVAVKEACGVASDAGAW